MAPAQPELKKVSPASLNWWESSTLSVSKSRSNAQPPEALLTRLQYLDKRLFVQLNGSRKVIGVLRGYDVSVFRACLRSQAQEEANVVVQVFLNIVLDEAVEQKDGGEKIRLGMVVRAGFKVS
jgi:small nuclear ribonucleoprotein G